MIRIGDSIRLSDRELDFLRILTQEPIERVKQIRTVDDLNRFLDQFEDWYREDTPKIARFFREELDKFRNIPDAA